MQPVSRLSFAKNALASGLVSQADLDAAIAQFRADKTKAADPQASRDVLPDGHPTDEQLADQLVMRNRLSRFQATQLLTGNTKFNLGPYRIVDALGQGGMGQVFRAEHAIMGRTVAVKVLPKSKSTPEAIAYFTREIRAQAALDHENLVRALDAGHDGNVYFLVCEYVPGADLRRYLRDRGPLGMGEAATIITQAAQGLEHAHQNGLIHRDVKPANLLVTPEGHTKVSDLGLVGSLSDADNDPRAGKVVGTADYLAPEQLRSPRSVTAASDVYSLGCTIYYAVTGKVPYPGGNVRDKIRRHCEDTPLHPRLLNPSLSEAFVEVIAAMMEKDPANRISTAAEVVERLKPWAGETVSSPRDPEVVRRLREGDFELDSGGGEIVDTSISFQFDLATPPHGQPRTAEAAPPAVPVRRMIDAPPIPAKPIASLPPGQQFPIHLAGAAPLAMAKKRRSWSMTTVLALVATVILGGLIAILVQLARN
ncbi:MAG: serine/threonine-protein kinase [Pirellulales bacterium]